MTNRRQLITGLISLVAAPAIVRAASLMPVRNIEGWVPITGLKFATTGLDGLMVERMRIDANWNVWVCNQIVLPGNGVNQ